MYPIHYIIILLSWHSYRLMQLPWNAIFVCYTPLGNYINTCNVHDHNYASQGEESLNSYRKD